jgi:hypothetical protein
MGCGAKGEEREREREREIMFISSGPRLGKLVVSLEGGVGLVLKSLYISHSTLSPCLSAAVPFVSSVFILKSPPPPYSCKNICGQNMNVS